MLFYKHKQIDYRIKKKLFLTTDFHYMGKNILLFKVVWNDMRVRQVEWHSPFKPNNFSCVISMILTLVDEDLKPWERRLRGDVRDYLQLDSNEIQASFSRIHLEHGFDCAAEEMQYHQRAWGITKAERKMKATRWTSAFVWPFIKMLMRLWHVPSCTFA